MSETSKPDYRENPAPERIHGIEVSIEGAPGEFRYDDELFKMRLGVLAPTP